LLYGHVFFLTVLISDIRFIMTSVDDIPMFDSNLGFQPPNSQRHQNFEDYSFAFDPTNTATICTHRELQEILDGGNPMTTMTNISKGHAEKAQASHNSTASSHNNEIDSLKRYAPSGSSFTGTNQTREVMKLNRETKEQVEKIEKLHEMFVSLVNTVAKQGVAM
jgi:hypothetical protein